MASPFLGVPEISGVPLLGVAGHTPAPFMTSIVQYAGGFPTGLAGVGVPAVDTLSAVPILLPRAVVLSNLGFNVSVAGGAGSVARVGIYRANVRSTVNTAPIPFYPGELLLDGGEKDTNTTGNKDTATNLELEAGLYWLAYLAGVLAPTIKTLSTASVWPFFGFNKPGTTALSGIFKGGVAYGALPNPYPLVSSLIGDDKAPWITLTLARVK